jgi:hypothetical protein
MYRREKINYRKVGTTRSTGQEGSRNARKAAAFIIALISAGVLVYLTGSWQDTRESRTDRSPGDEVEVVIRYEACVRTSPSQRQLLTCIGELGNTLSSSDKIDAAAGRPGSTPGADTLLARSQAFPPRPQPTM